MFFSYRKARNQCIIEKLSPILAGIIAEVDTNSNLDLLIQTDPNSWKHNVWLEIINDPSATGIEYSMIVSPKKQQELPEVVVKGTGCEGKKFRARMPFSWLIYKLIDRIIRTSQDVDKHGKSTDCGVQSVRFLGGLLYDILNLYYKNKNLQDIAICI